MAVVPIILGTARAILTMWYSWLKSLQPRSQGLEEDQDPGNEVQIFAVLSTSSTASLGTGKVLCRAEISRTVQESL
jgi:hypothetical protein